MWCVDLFPVLCTNLLAICDIECTLVFRTVLSDCCGFLILNGFSCCSWFSVVWTKYTNPIHGYDIPGMTFHMKWLFDEELDILWNLWISLNISDHLLTLVMVFIFNKCDEQRFTKFRYRNYKYYLAKPLYLLFLGRDWFFDAIGWE